MDAGTVISAGQRLASAPYPQKKMAQNAITNTAAAATGGAVA